MSHISIYTRCLPFIVALLMTLQICSQSVQLVEKKRPRDYKIDFGIFSSGDFNAITDVKGVRVGHTTIIEGDSIRTGVTAILAHEDNIFQQKVPAAIFIANGFGKLAGYSQVEELGYIETPIILTNTLSVGQAIQSTVKYVLSQAGNQFVSSVNAVVGETNDAYLNDIRGMHVNENHILGAILGATEGRVMEGNVGAGTGTVCFGFKGGIGTSSRVLPKSLGGYTVGVLVQTNFGGDLRIGGKNVGQSLGTKPYRKHLEGDGSCMIVVMTDAPLDARNLKRLAKRAILGLGRTGGSMSNGSGDYVIAVSTHPGLRLPHDSEVYQEQSTSPLHNDLTSPLFMAAIEATEEAIINSLFAAESLTGRNGHQIKALPVDQVLALLNNK